MGTTFYKVRMNRLSFGEIWRMSPDPLTGTIACGLRLFGALPEGGDLGFCKVDALHVLDPDEIPDRVHDLWTPPLDACEEGGIGLRFYYTVPTVGRNIEGYAAAMLGDRGLIAAQALYARQNDMEQTVLAFYTPLGDGSYLLTTSNRKQLEPLPGGKIARLPNQPPESILARHRERVAEEPGVVPVEEEDLESLIADYSNREIDFHAGRGVYVPMSEAEVAALRGSKSPYALLDELEF